MSLKKNLKGIAIKGPSEKHIETQILSWLKAQGLFAFKIENGGVYDRSRGVFRFNGSSSIRGVADIYCLHRGLSIWIEVKSAKGRQSEHQIEFANNIMLNGGIYLLARSIEDVEYGLKMARVI